MPENTYYNPRNDEVIASSREAAIVRLNTYPIEVGKTVYIKYYADLNKTCIDALVAIGITNGTGPGTYSIISDKGIALVTKIVLELPDVTELVHGQLYLYHDPATNLNYYVYLKTMTRIITLVKESVMLVTAETGKLWWVETSLLKDLTNFYTKEEIDAMDFAGGTKNKGLFPTLEDLERAVPDPKPGDWAIIGNTIPGSLWRYEEPDGWKDTGTTGGADVPDLSGYVTKEEMTETVSSLTDLISSSEPLFLTNAEYQAALDEDLIEDGRIYYVYLDE